MVVEAGVGMGYPQKIPREDENTWKLPATFVCVNFSSVNELSTDSQRDLDPQTETVQSSDSFSRKPSLIISQTGSSVSSGHPCPLIFPHPSLTPACASPVQHRLSCVVMCQCPHEGRGLGFLRHQEGHHCCPTQALHTKGKTSNRYLLSYF